MISEGKVTHKARRPRGTGGLYKDSRGYWCATVELPPDPVTGKRRRSIVRAKTQDAVKQKLREKLREFHKSGDVRTSVHTVESWMWHWFETIDRSKPSTRSGIKSGMINYIFPTIGKERLRNLKPQHVRKIEQYVLAKGLSTTTARNAQSYLSSALGYAEDEGLIDRNPVLKRTKAPVDANTTRNALTAAEAIKVLYTVRNDRLGSRWASALMLGARQGELLGLELDQVDLNRDMLFLEWSLNRIAWQHGCTDTEQGPFPCGTVTGAGCPERHIKIAPNHEHRHLDGQYYLLRPKSRTSIRPIPLVSPLREFIMERLASSATEPNPHGLLWTSEAKRARGGHNGFHGRDVDLPPEREVLPLDGSPIDAAVDSRAWGDVLERAGVRRIKLHEARHTAATLLAEAGVPREVARDILGHYTIEMTKKYMVRPADTGAARDGLKALMSSLDGGHDQPVTSERQVEGG